MALIREMDISDYPQVIKLWSETEAMQLRDADSHQNISKYLSLNPGLSFVAMDNTKITGAILAGTDGRRGYIQHLAVCSTCQGLGIGAKLLLSAIDALKEQGIPKTHLFVANENINAQHFYEKLGWFPRDEVRMYSFNSSDLSNV
ncbi:GNAT family N-acetyltransferase [Photobacterium satsumensis]|uniref:GNAT family N-acetyltransferase n=1 Tax=Photobacterium satsumensis TaxID=2910239 RepID=UPI003D0A8FC5